MLKNYLQLTRPDHWFKNIFMLPGIVLVFLATGTAWSSDYLLTIFIAIISICATASANYVINEWLDAEFDKYHPVKKNRPSVVNNLQAKWIYLMYIILLVIGFSTAYFISNTYLYITIFFATMGFMYNVRPFRTKERPYIDVLSESINNPIRLCLGWYIIDTAILPPSSLLISYWMGGAFLMGAKRFAEYRFIDNKELAGLYRSSFKYYNEQRLLLSTIFYALTSVFFLSIFLFKHRIEFLLAYPFFSILFVWYLSIAFEKDSVVQNPEKLHRKKGFLLFVLLLVILSIFLSVVDIPVLYGLMG